MLRVLSIIACASLLLCGTGFEAVGQDTDKRPPEIVYERKLTDEEKSRYQVGGGVIAVDPTKSADELRKYYGGQGWDSDWRTVKVELLYRGADANRPSHVRILDLGTDLRRAAEEEKWKKEAPARVSLGKDTQGFKHLRTTLRFVGPHYIYFEGLDHLGSAVEEFEGPKGERIRATIYEVPNHTITLHEFLRSITGFQYSPVQTEIGTVLAIESKQARPPKKQVGVAWTSGKNLALYVDGADVDVKDIVRLYGQKFPSSLPRNTTIDKTSWGREEVDTGIKRLKRIVKGERFDASRDDCFVFHRQRLFDYAYIPVLQFDVDSDISVRRKAVAAVQEWWEQFKDKTYWDEDLGILVAKGQTPADMKQAAQNAKRQKEEALLAKALTEAEITVAVSQLTKDFEDTHRREAARSASARGKELGGDRVTWRKVRDGEWTLQYPSANNGPLIIQTFTGPEIQKTGDSKVPLRAVFSVQYHDQATGTKDTLREEYYYYRLHGHWSETPPND